MKRRIFALLLAAALTGASFAPVAAEDSVLETMADSEVPEGMEAPEADAAGAQYDQETIAAYDEAYEDSFAEDGTGDAELRDAFEEEVFPAGDADSYVEYAEELAEEAPGQASGTGDIPAEGVSTEDKAPEGLPIDETHFPDPVFREYIQKNFDTDGNGALSEEERAKVVHIDLERSETSEAGSVSSLAGLEYFEKLESLYCSGNALTTLDVSRCTALQELSCGNNALTSLNVSGCTELASLECANNKLTSLNVSMCPALTYFICYENALTELNVSSCANLTYFSCDANKLTSLDVSKCTALELFTCSENELTDLSVKQCKSLYYLSCESNPLSNVVICGSPALAKAYKEGTQTDYGTAAITYWIYIETEKNVDGAVLCADKTARIVSEHAAQVSVPALDPKCTEAGNTAEEICSHCGEVLTAKTTKPALGHTFGAWTVTKPATTVSEGTETRTCTRCGAAETRAVPKLQKKANTLAVRGKTPSLDAGSLKKKQTIAASKAFIIRNAQGTVTFRKQSGSSNKLSISAVTGNIVVKRGTKKGTYKIKVAVRAAGNDQYEAATKTVTVKVKVK